MTIIRTRFILPVGSPLVFAKPRWLRQPRRHAAKPGIILHLASRIERGGLALPNVRSVDVERTQMECGNMLTDINECKQTNTTSERRQESRPPPCPEAAHRAG